MLQLYSRETVGLSSATRVFCTMNEISSGIVAISSGVTSTGLLVIQEGVLQILNGGRAEETGVFNGGKIVVSQGGILYTCTVSAGGTATVLSNGLARNVTVENGGLYVVSGGGSSIRSFVRSGGSQIAYAGVKVLSAFVENGGQLRIQSGALARSPVISQGGIMYQMEGGLSDQAQLYGTLEINASAGADSATVFDGGKIAVRAEGHAYKPIVSSGGVLDVSSGGVINSAHVYQGGAVSAAAGASSYNMEISGGRVTLAGGTAEPTAVSGAYLSSAAVHSGGALIISSGATALKIRENGGFVDAADGADVTFTPNTIDHLLLENTSATVHSDTTAAAVEVGRGGLLSVFDGGTANGIVENGGWVEITDGATVSFTPNTISDLTLADASATVHSGTVLSGVAVDAGGRLEVFSGGKMTGRMSFAEGAIVSAAKDAVLDFDLSQIAPGAETRVSGLSLVQGTPVYTLTVSDSQEKGGYTLADGAADFDGAITVRNTLGESIGTLTVDGTLETDNRLYTLNLDDDVLSLTCYALIKDRIISHETVSVTPYEFYRNPIVNYSGYLIVSSGGMATGATVNDGGSLRISSGGIANSTTVNSKGGLYISSGGTANSTTVNTNGRLIVSRSGTANNTTVNGDGRIFVSSGGTANSTTVNDRGSMYVSTGGTATNVIASPGARFVFAVASDTYVQGCVDGIAFEIKDAFISGYTVNSGGSLIVSRGGTANSTTVNSRGNLNIEYGGLANSTTVNWDGSMFVSSGGTANSTTVNGGGFYVSRGGTANSTTVNSRGNLNIEYGGLANSTTVNGGSMYISSGGTANTTTINAMGSMFVSSGGTVNSTTVNSGGLIVYSGGTANSTTVNDRGSMYVSSGGTATSVITSPGAHFVFAVTSDTYVQGCVDGSAFEMKDAFISGYTVNSGGSLIVSSGGTANGIIENGGYVDIADGADVTFASNTISGLILSGTATVHSGTTANSTTVNAWGNLYVYSGGAADSTTVNDGKLTVYSGGTATNVIASPGARFVFTVASDTYVQGCVDGSAFEMKDAFISGYTVNSGGSLIVSKGGTANSTTVNSVGYLFVSSGGTANGIIENGGYVDVKDGANVSFVPNTISGLILSRASATVHSGTTANSTTVNDGKLTVYSGGTANSTTVSGYNGGLYVYSGGTVNSTTVNDGKLTVYSGGTANSTTVNYGGYLEVNSGGTANEIIENGGDVHVDYGADVTFVPNTISGLILSRGGATVHSGTTANSTTVNGRCCLCVYSGGTVNSTTVNYYGSMYVSSGGTANSTTVNDGGRLLVFNSGTANSTTVNGGLYVYSGGTANSTTVNSGGYLSVADGGTANSTTVNNGGRFSVSIGGTATEIIENGGYVYVADGADVTFVPNTISGLILSSASATVHSGTTANSTTVNGGGFYVSSGGTANGTTVNAWGDFYVSSGGTANSTTVNAWGDLYVSSGGTATDIVWTPCEGHVFIDEGGYASFVLQYSGVYYGSGNQLLSSATVMDGMIINSYGEMNVMNGGTANSTTVNSMGSMYVYSGGTANSTTVNSMGSMYVYSGGTANSTTVNRGGSMYVFSGGTANSTTVNTNGRLIVSRSVTANNTTVNWGSMYISSGGTANSTTVNGGGSMYVFSGGTANSTTVNAWGDLYVSSGGKLTGKMVFEEEAIVSMYEGAILNFDLTQVNAGATALVNDLSIIRGTSLYTLTVDPDLKPGMYAYKLADGAAEFNSTISVVNTAGDTLGALTVGETVKVGYDSYTLNLTDSLLSVTVDVPDLTPQNAVGTPDKVSWESTGADQYIVEYSTDNFGHVIQVVTSGSAVDTPDLPAGTYQWRVKAVGNSEWAVGDDIVSDNTPGPAKAVLSNEDGCGDIFFADVAGTWGGGEYMALAMNAGSVNDWLGTNELVIADGKGRIQNLFFGSSDPNVLCLTDGDNGDAIFVDDVYTDSPEDIAKNTARLYKIQEIRAGAGDDIVDMTSRRFEYTGDGMTVRGGDGSDVIWANKGKNFLFGDAGNDRIVGASDNDVIAGGIGNDSMHGGGGNDLFTFCGNWGADTVEQLADGKVTLWFAAESDTGVWDEASLTYTDGNNSVAVSGVSADRITLKFGDSSPEDAEQFAALSGMGAFADFTSQKIFEESGTGILANA